MSLSPSHTRMGTHDAGRFSPDAAGLPCVLLLLLLWAHLAGAASLDPARPPGGNFDLTRWYLGTPDTPQSLSIPTVELIDGHTSAWFFTAPDGAMAFWAPVTGGTTSGSSYPRSELREQLNPPENSINWTVRGTHILEAECRVRILPSSGTVIIGQIHGYLGDARPLFKLVYNRGTLDAQVKQSPSSDTDLHHYFPNIPTNSLIAYRIVLEDGVLHFTINGETRSAHLLANDPAWAEQTFYFKAGAYVIDNSGNSSEGGRVDFYRLETSHANHPPEAPVLLREPAPLSAPATSNAVLSVAAAGGLPLHYQWHRDGVPIPGATFSYLPFRPLSPLHEGLYHATVSNLAGAVTSAPAFLTVLTTNAAFTLAEALDTTNLAWTTSGSPPWIGTHGAAQDGLDQAQAGPLEDDSAVTLQTTVTGPGQIRFWWRVSSQTNDDYLVFSIGGSAQARLSGSVPWQERSFAVPAGSQTLRWTYEKGEELRAGADRAWVDGVRFLPQPPLLTSHPASQAPDAGGTVVLSATATGPGPLRYQWQCEGTNLLDSPATRGTTNATLTLSNIQPAQSGFYRLLVRNAGGEVASSNALVSVSPTLPLPDSLDAPHLAWTSSGHLPWIGQAATSHDDGDAARSGRIGHSQSSILQTTLAGPGTLRFWWKVSCEPGNDRVVLTRNGSEVARLSGEVDWQPASLALPAGSHLLRWTYSKNSSVIRGQDAAWVDGLDYVPLLPPAAPADLAATPLSLSAIRLDWTDAAANETGFLLEGSTNGLVFLPLASLRSNTVSFVRTGLLAGTTWHFRLRATNAAGASPWAGPVSAATLPFTGAHINFQPASAAVPAGCLVDGGLAYAARGNGLVFGWNSSRTSSAVDRNSSLSPDQRHDTLISAGTSTGTRWELAVPAGDYHVFLVAGDPASSSGTLRLSVEGHPALLGSLTATQRWISNRVIVPVQDGRLSLSNLAGASNNKLCFVEVTQLTPLLDCPANATVECGQPWSFITPTPLADPCGSGPAILLEAGTVTNTPAACPGLLQFTRTWIAFDSCGHSNTCAQTVTLVDTTPPALSCPADRTVEAGQPWDFGTPSATDAGSSPSVSTLQTVTNHTGPGTLTATRTWLAADACANASTCSQTVTVVDTTPPSLPDADVPACEGGPAPVLPTATDLADPAPRTACTQADGQPLPAPFPPGIHPVLCTATDAAGNTTHVSFRVVMQSLLAATAPTNQSCAPGDLAFFAVTPAAGEVRSAQWQFNGNPLPDATNLTLTFPVTDASQAGTYCLVLAGPCDTLTLCASLAVTAPPPPPAPANGPEPLSAAPAAPAPPRAARPGTTATRTTAQTARAPGPCPAPPGSTGRAAGGPPA